MAAAPAPNSQQEMRRRNLSRVLHAVSEEGSASRAAVAARIGLTRAAVSTLVDELLRAGLLVELGPGRADGGVGRPGSALALDDRGPCGIGAEVGVDYLSVCAVDLRGRVRVRAREASANRDSHPGEVLARLGEMVHQAVAEAASTGLSPAGITLSVPGLVARGTTTVVRAPNLGWHDTDIAAHFPSPAGLPLKVENEANLGALAELWLGGRQDGSPDTGSEAGRTAESGTGAEGMTGDPPRDFIHVSAKAGIGAALVLDGELLRGTRGFAGELGHVPVRPGGPRCGCGGRGCLEQYAGEAAVLRAAGISARHLLNDGAHEQETSPAGLLSARAADGDPRARRALRDAGTALGIALAGAVNLLDPRAVVLGGTLAPLGPWMLPALRRELTRRTAAPGAVPELVVSALGPDGPLLGAAHSVVRTVLDAPLSHASAAGRS
ncbi:ROK family protein [Streptomyces sp. HNM0574]|uniref:ROK family protein n=1 Tax=Streptomyces sp. HNM0574 TaxID=2714954 RepID=UPI00146F7A47|nr:ROK family protein [Streptomyces sp. HNM0574]NLU68722.1 ROK family protein [Streptomyces sp. HNM0574]